MSMNKGWKDFEKRVAISIGGRRISVKGEEDVEHPAFSIECKLLKSLPQWLIDLWTQTQKNCPKGKIPIAIVKQKKLNDKNAFVILRFEDFKGLIDK